MTFSVLFVCTGNICRSPLAEKLFAARLSAAVPIEASSAGTSGLSGYPMDLPSAQALRQLGGDPDGHSARRLTEMMVAEADLILTADGKHRAAAIALSPKAFRRTFTLREFAHLGAGLPPLAAAVTVAALQQRVVEVAAQRGEVAVLPRGAEEIGDPFGASARVLQQSVEQIDTAVTGLLHALGLEVEPSGGPVLSASPIHL